MGVYLVGVLVALATAALVVVLAIGGSDERTSWRTFRDDFRNGLRRRGRDAEPEPEVEPVDVSFEDLFEAEAQPGDDYLQLDEFAERIERAGDRTVQLWQHGREQRAVPPRDAGAATPAAPTEVRTPAARPGPRRTAQSHQR